eukprot:TRINITY_DN653_c1_g2_i2.p1 TRINITY_DN653_c1_g2~~TRINITY_DN653_c1_g2_i2.p1  ORF type:complete len:295 (-),score=31.07 TRINITY_DN653_c1_g2_i2:325-1209(-)
MPQTRATIRKAAANEPIRSQKETQLRAMTRTQAAAEHPILLSVVAEYILAYLPPSLMVRSTCAAFRNAVEKIHEPVRKQWTTPAADAVTSTTLIRWAMQNKLTPKMAQKACIRRGDIAGLQALNLCGLPLTAHWRYTVLAAECGHLPMLRWLRQIGCPLNSHTCISAARHGHLEVLQWARAEGCAWDEKTCSEAASGGHLAVLQWARAAACHWRADTCSKAARGGHLEVLQWAHANWCPWDEATCSSAAIGGHLEVLQWARANGCPWDYMTSRLAKVFGHVHVLQWALANGCPE